MFRTRCSIGLSVVKVVFFATKTFLTLGLGLAGTLGVSSAGCRSLAVLSRSYMVFSGSLG